jgi:hypothetical protein
MKPRRKWKKNKKAYVRTLEAFFAFFITFVFIVFIVMKGIGAKPLKEPLDTLPAVEQRDDFRDCIYAENTTCAEDIVDPFIPSAYRFKISINSPEPFKGAKDIYTETTFIVSNQTNDYKIVYLYYWPVSG